MNETRYGMTTVAEFLGISRQGAYARKEKEKWRGCGDEKDGDSIAVPSSVIAESRDLERQRLLERIALLDDLAERQRVSNVLEEIRVEHNL